MKFITTTETRKKWELSSHRIGVLCNEEHIPDVQKADNTWLSQKMLKNRPMPELKAANISKR